MKKLIGLSWLWVGVFCLSSVQAKMTESSEQATQVWLQKQLAKVLKTAPEVLAMTAERSAMDARVEAAQQPLYNPEVSIETEQSQVNSTRLGLSQTIDWQNRQTVALQMARAERLALQAAQSWQKVQLGAKFLRTWGTYHVASELVELSQQRIQILSQFVSVATHRFESGDLTQQEVDLARLSLMQARLEAVSIEQAQQKALAQLQTWQVNIEPEVHLPTRLPVVSMTDAQLASMWEQHPLARQLKAKLKLAELTVVQRQRQQGVNPTVGVVLGQEGSDGVIGVSLSLPLQVRNTYQAEVSEAQAVVRKIQAQMRQQKLQWLAMVRARLKAYQAQRQAWQQWQQQGQLSLTRQEQTLSRLWQAGALSTTDYLVQLKQVLETQQSAFKQREAYWQAWVNWLESRGKVFNTSDLLE